MSESNTQFTLDDAIDAVFAKLNATAETPDVISSETQTLAEVRKASAEAEAQYRAAIDKVFAALNSPEPKPAANSEFISADFLPRAETRDGHYVQAQPWWSR